MPQIVIFDTEATDIKEPVLIEAAWLEVTSLTPLTIGETFVQRYNPGKPISLGALATHHILGIGSSISFKSFWHLRVNQCDVLRKTAILNTHVPETVSLIDFKNLRRKFH